MSIESTKFQRDSTPRRDFRLIDQSPRGSGSGKRQTLLNGEAFGQSLSSALKSKVVANVGHHDENIDIIQFISNTISKFKRDFAKSRVGKLYRNIIFVSSILSGLVYIAQTYVIYDPEGYRYRILRSWSLALAAIFTVDWIMNLIFAEYRFAYATSYLSIIDFCVIVSTWVLNGHERVPYGEVKSQRQARIYALHILNTATVLRVLKVREKLYLIKDEVEQCLAKICIIIGTLILFWSAIMEYLEADQGYLYHTWSYYAVVTISTVGYGDLSPHSLLGRVACQFMIGTAIITVPQLTQELIEKMARKSIYARAVYQPKFRSSKHIIICGDIKSTDLDLMFKELFHRDHFDNDPDLDVVILQPRAPTNEILDFLRLQSSNFSFVYLEGSALFESDLQRARAETASAFFLMTNKFCSEYDEVDAEIIMQKFNIKRYINKHLYKTRSKKRSVIPLFCTQLLRSENKKHLLGNNDGDDELFYHRDSVICLQELKMGILAKAALYPGACTLILNIFSTFDLESLKKFCSLTGVEDKQHFKFISSDNDDNNSDVSENQTETFSSWKLEYLRGCEWEVYCSELSSEFEGAKFIEVSALLYENLGIVLFGLHITDRKSGESGVFLNPKNYYIPSNQDYDVEGIVLAKNKASSNLVFETLHTSTDAKARAIRTSINNSNDKKRGRSASTNPSPSSSREEKKSNSNGNHHASGWDLVRSSIFVRLEHETDQEHNDRIEEEHFKKSHYLRDNLIDQSDIIVKSSISKEVPSINNHIIIMGKGILNIHELIRPLRAKNLGKVKPIVILHHEEIPLFIWTKICMYDSLYIVRGSHLEEADIRRAGIYRAQQVIVLADTHHDIPMEGDIQDVESLLDSDAIFSYQCVRRLNPKAHVVVELIRQSNIDYLDSTSREAVRVLEPDFRLSSKFASGAVLATSVLDTLACQCYHNNRILDIAQKLVSGTEILDAKQITARMSLLPGMKEQAFSQSASPVPTNLHTIKGSALYQIAIPESTKTYGELYKYLANRDMVPLGILRGILPDLSMGPRYNRDPYVVTNPVSATELYSCDKVFVLSSSPIIQSKANIKDVINDLQAQYKFGAGGMGNTQLGKPKNTAQFDVKEFETKFNTMETNMQIMFNTIMKAMGKSEEEIPPFLKSSSENDEAVPKLRRSSSRKTMTLAQVEEEDEDDDDDNSSKGNDKDIGLNKTQEDRKEEDRSLTSTSKVLSLVNPNRSQDLLMSPANGNESLSPMVGVSPSNPGSSPPFILPSLSSLNSFGPNTNADLNQTSNIPIDNDKEQNDDRSGRRRSSSKIFGFNLSFKEESDAADVNTDSPIIIRQTVKPPTSSPSSAVGSPTISALKTMGTRRRSLSRVMIETTPEAVQPSNGNESENRKRVSNTGSVAQASPGSDLEGRKRVSIIDPLRNPPIDTPSERTSSRKGVSASADTQYKLPALTKTDSGNGSYRLSDLSDGSPRISERDQSQLNVDELLAIRERIDRTLSVISSGSVVLQPGSVQRSSTRPSETKEQLRPSWVNENSFAESEQSGPRIENNDTPRGSQYDRSSPGQREMRRKMLQAALSASKGQEGSSRPASIRREGDARSSRTSMKSIGRDEDESAYDTRSSIERQRSGQYSISSRQGEDDVDDEAAPFDVSFGDLL